MIVRLVQIAAVGAARLLKWPASDRRKLFDDLSEIDKEHVRETLEAKRNVTDSNPAVTDDETEGYSKWSLWINTVTGHVYRCVDASEGAAVWVKTTLTADDLGALAVGNTASDVPYGESDVATELARLTHVFDQAVFVSATGDDSFSGLELTRPKKTIGAAITVAEALLADNAVSVRVHVLDGNRYQENITVPPNVMVDAQGATLVGAASISGNSELYLDRHYPLSNNQNMLSLGDAADGPGIYTVNVSDGRGEPGGTPTTGVRNVRNIGGGGKNLFVRAGIVFVGEDGIGIGDTTGGTGHVHILIPDLYLAGANAVGILGNAQGPASTDIVGFIDHIIEFGTPNGCTGISLTASGASVKLVAAEIVAETAYNIASGSLHLSCPKITGTQTGTPVQKMVGTVELALKAPINNPTFTGTVGGVTKEHVGLGNADNTSDADKPVSTAQGAAIGERLEKTENLADLVNVSTARANLGTPDPITDAMVTYANDAGFLPVPDLHGAVWIKSSTSGGFVVYKTTIGHIDYYLGPDNSSPMKYIVTSTATGADHLFTQDTAAGSPLGLYTHSAGGSNGTLGVRRALAWDLANEALWIASTAQFFSKSALLSSPVAIAANALALDMADGQEWSLYETDDDFAVTTTNRSATSGLSRIARIKNTHESNTLTVTLDEGWNWPETPVFEIPPGAYLNLTLKCWGAAETDVDAVATIHLPATML